MHDTDAYEDCNTDFAPARRMVFATFDEATDAGVALLGRNSPWTVVRGCGPLWRYWRVVDECGDEVDLHRAAPCPW